MIKKRYKRYNTRKKTIAQHLTLVVKIFAALVLLSLITWGVPKIKNIDTLKTKIEWQVDNNLPINQSILKTIVQPLIKDKVQLDLIKIKQVLENEPWVVKAYVKRLFFNAIQINVESQQIAMRWENTECKTEHTPSCSGYISNNGTLFTPQKRVKSDAALARSKADQGIVTQLYQDYQNYQKAVGKMNIKSLSKTHIDQLIFTPNIKVILGCQQKQQRLARFLKVYAKLRKTTSKAKLNRATFDMRYPKGFVLKL